MFYEGPLQDGIALAVREAKLVVCFVRGSSFVVQSELPRVVCTVTNRVVYR